MGMILRLGAILSGARHLPPGQSGDICLFMML